jgi:hypothetical protein
MTSEEQQVGSNTNGSSNTSESKAKKHTQLTNYKPCKTKHKTKTRLNINTKYKTIKLKKKSFLSLNLNPNPKGWWSSH